MSRVEESAALCAVIGRIATERSFADRFGRSPPGALAELGVTLEEGEILLAQRAIALLAPAHGRRDAALDQLVRAVDRMIQA